VIAALIAGVAVLVLLSFAFALGGVLLPILAVLAGLVVVGWVLLAGIARRSPPEVAERAHEREFLGPGGPDDPRT
jgi:membrane protein implicated in regulation of membrane protease activity